MQYTVIFQCCKNGNFQMKTCDIFLIFAQNTVRGYSLEPPHCKPQFYYIKWGVRGYKSHGHVFLMRNLVSEFAAMLKHTHANTVYEGEPRTFEPRSEKTGLRGFRQGLTQTRLCSHRRWLEA